MKLIHFLFFYFPFSLCLQDLRLSLWHKTAFIITFYYFWDVFVCLFAILCSVLCSMDDLFYIVNVHLLFSKVSVKKRGYRSCLAPCIVVFTFSKIEMVCFRLMRITLNTLKRIVRTDSVQNVTSLPSSLIFGIALKLFSKSSTWNQTLDPQTNPQSFFFEIMALFWDSFFCQIVFTIASHSTKAPLSCTTESHQFPALPFPRTIGNSSSHLPLLVTFYFHYHELQVCDYFVKIYVHSWSIMEIF